MLTETNQYICQIQLGEKLETKQKAINLQENKLNYMQRDLDLEKKEIELEKQLEEHDKLKSNNIQQSIEENTIWEKLMEEFDMLKDRKQKILEEDEKLEEIIKSFNRDF